VSAPIGASLSTIVVRYNLDMAVRHAIVLQLCKQSDPEHKDAYSEHQHCCCGDSKDCDRLDMLELAKLQ
jgi:hypothetical protein